MSIHASNGGSIRRVSPSDEAYLRRYRAEMKFVGAGTPHAPVLDSRVGRRFLPITKERYSADSAERYNIASAIQGTHAGDVLIPYMAAARTARPKRHGRGGGRRVSR